MHARAHPHGQVMLAPVQVLYSLEAHTDRVTRVACQDDTILSGGFDGSAHLWHF